MFATQRFQGNEMISTDFRNCFRKRMRLFLRRYLRLYLRRYLRFTCENTLFRCSCIFYKRKRMRRYLRLYLTVFRCGCIWNVISLISRFFFAFQICSECDRAAGGASLGWVPGSGAVVRSFRRPDRVDLAFSSMQWWGCSSRAAILATWGEMFGE